MTVLSCIVHTFRYFALRVNFLFVAFYPGKTLLANIVKLMKFFLLLLLFPFCAPAKDLCQIHRLSEKDIQQIYLRTLRDACHYADRDWTNLPPDSAEGYWGDGVSGGNEGTRTVGSMDALSTTM